MKNCFRLCVLVCLGICTTLNAGQLPKDTLLARYYDKAADFLGEGEADSAQYYFDQAFAVKGVENSPVYPALVNEQGTLYAFIGENDKAMAMKKKAMGYLPQVDDLEKHISVYHDLGILYRRQNMNDSALHYYNKALEVAVRYKDESWLAHLGMNVSVLYFNMRRLTEAERCVDQAVTHLERADDPYVEVCTWQIRSMTKAELGKMDEAGVSIRKAWSVASGKDGQKDWQMRCLPSLLNYYAKMEQKDSVDYFLRKGELLLKELPENSFAAIGFVQAKAEICFRYGDYKETFRIFRRLLDAGSLGTMRNIVYQRMAVCCRELGQAGAAIAYMDSARMWTDSLAQENLTTKMAEFSALHQTQEKELEIIRLRQEQLEKDAFWMKVGIAVLILVAVLAIGSLVLWQKRRLAYAKMEQMRQESELNAARKYIEGLEGERKRFAKELHDGIANDLLGLQLRMGLSEGKVDAKHLEVLIGGMRENIRRISHELMPPEFTRLDLNDILSDYLHTVGKHIQTHVDYESASDADYKSIPHEVAYEIYRIVQELVANILKYSEATDVRVSLKETDRLRFELKVSDNGKGMPSDGFRSQGIGLRTIEDRIKAIGGTFKIDSLMQGGSQFTLTFVVGKTDTRK